MEQYVRIVELMFRRLCSPALAKVKVSLESKLSCFCPAYFILCFKFKQEEKLSILGEDMLVVCCFLP